MKNLKTQIPVMLAVILLATIMLTFNQTSANSDQLQINYTSTFTGQMAGSAFTSNGTLFAGDTNNNLYRSDDNGSSFKLIYAFPKVSSVSDFKNYVWNLFVDSKDSIFVSVIGSNSLYRSIDFGASFSKVLNTNGTQNDGLYIAITEDSNGALYAATYCNSIFPHLPPILKSTDGGATWTIIAEFSVVHYHNIKFNPYNGYLYIVTGESAWGYPNGYAECVLRSKDNGQTWTAIIQRAGNTSNTLYGPILFYENWVYLGTEQAYKTNWIDRFYDNGSNTFEPKTVYTFPTGNFPVISAVWLGNTMLFSTTPEFNNGNSTIATSEDGTNWSIIKSTETSPSLRYTNTLTTNPKGLIFGSDSYNQTFVIKHVAESQSANPDEANLPSVSNSDFNQLQTIVGLIIVIGFSFAGSMMALRLKKKSSTKIKS